MTKSYLINKDLFEAGRKFVQDCQKDGKTVKTGALEELREVNPTLALKIFHKVIFYGQK